MNHVLKSILLMVGGGVAGTLLAGAIVAYAHTDFAASAFLGFAGGLGGVLPGMRYLFKEL